MYRQLIAICYQIHTKHINSLREQNVGSLNVEPCGTLQEFNKQSAKRDIGTAV